MTQAKEILNSTIYADTSYRYSVIGEALQTSSGSILEIGGLSTGYRGTLIAKWPKRPVTINHCIKANARPEIIADACDLPLIARSFDQVVLIDVLEHVPNSVRAKVIQEALRVAERRVLLMFPFRSNENFEAECRLAATLKNRGNVSKPSLNEHLLYGLPIVKDVVLHANPTLWNVKVRYVTHRQLLFISLGLQALIHHQRHRKAVSAFFNVLLTVADQIVTRQRAYRVLLSFTRNLMH